MLLRDARGLTAPARKRRSRRCLGRLLLWLPQFVVIASCGPLVDFPSDAGTGAGCDGNPDCTIRRCANGECTPCQDSTDCRTGEVCVVGGCYSKDCEDVSCGAGQVCLPDAGCADTSCVGVVCPTGQACVGGACGDDCVIDGTSYHSGTLSPNSPCQGCQPTVSTLGWSNLSDGAGCGIGLICASGTCSSDCDIGGAIYSFGMTDPANPCHICQPGTSTSAWTNLPNGSICGTALICASGVCASDCDIGDSIYTAGASDSNDPCESCQPSVSTAAWTRVPNGQSCGGGQICTEGKCGNGCDIGGTLFDSGATNPVNICQTCQPGVSTSAWTNLANGTSCGSGVICASGTCSNDCDIGVGLDQELLTAGTLNPANACQGCQPSVSPKAWTDLPTGASCGTGSICVSGNCSGNCDIGGTVYHGATPNPNNPCQSCQPSVSASAWSNLPDGTICAAGMICVSGTCASKCHIGETIYASGAANPSNVCQSCQPATSTSSWRNVPNGQSCGGGQICTQGNCGSGCNIGSSPYSSGAINPSNACQSCQPGVSTTAWTSLANGTTCGSGMICASGTCSGDCDIAGTIVASGTLNPANACQSCQPSASTSAWSNLANGTNCGTALSCASGSCANDCDIGGTLYTSGSLSPGNACQSCQPSASTAAWSNVPNGTNCGTALICTSGTCSSQCDIGGTIYSSGAVNPTNGCQDCQPSVSTTGWTTLSNGTACGTAMICASGVCASDCDIGGTILTSGTLNPMNGCQNCQPTSSTISWSNIVNGTSCGTGLICASGICANDCDIGGVLYPAGTLSFGNACQSCQPNVSTTAWTNVADGTACGIGLICASGTCASDCDIGGTSYASGSPDPSNECQSCQPSVSTSAWSNVANGTSCGTGLICASGACTNECYVGENFYDSGALDPGNACVSCQPSTSTSAWTDVPNGTNCGTNKACLSGVCGACTGTSQCLGGQVCVGGFCTACTSTTQCLDGHVCVNGACSACTSNSQCLNNQACISGACAPCTNDAECGGDPCGGGGDVCLNGACAATQCTKSSQCSSGQICLSGACVAYRCTSNSQCGGGSKACCGGYCTDTFCDSNNCGSCGYQCGTNNSSCPPYQCSCYGGCGC
jgi:hypothetical protein